MSTPGKSDFVSRLVAWVAAGILAAKGMQNRLLYVAISVLHSPYLNIAAVFEKVVGVMKSIFRYSRAVSRDLKPRSSSEWPNRNFGWHWTTMQTGLCSVGSPTISNL
ncbi:hypothetical protein ACJQWK_08162 [Exserohilum turcicum]